MDTFTPSGATYHDTAQLPVDLTDYRNAASVRVGIEAALDNIQYVKEYNGLFTGGNEGVSGSPLGSTTSATFGTGDYAILTGIWGADEGDVISFVVMCHGYTSAAAGAQYRIAYAIDGGARVGITNARVEFGSLDSDKVPMTIVGTFTVPAGGATDLELWIQLASPGATQTVYLQGPIGVQCRKGRAT